MDELNNLISEIQEVRKEKIREAMVEEPIKEYVKEILKAFKVSNEQKKSAVLLWQIKCMGGMGTDIIFALSFQRGENANFYNIDQLKEGRAGKIGNNYELIEYVNSLIIPKVAFQDIYDYLIKNNIHKQGFNVNLDPYKKDFIIELKE